MKKQFGVLFFFLLSGYVFCQSPTFVREQKKEQLIDMKRGTLLLPLFKTADSTLFQKKNTTLTKQKYNQEMLSILPEQYHFSKVLYYYIEDWKALGNKENIVMILFDAHKEPYRGRDDVSSFFMAELILNGYTKQEEIKVFALKKKQWVSVHRGKEKSNKKQSAYEQEINLFKRENFEEGLLVKRLLDKEKKLSKKRKVVMNFETYFPLHLALPSEEIIVRLAKDMETFFSKKYAKIAS